MTIKALNKAKQRFLDLLESKIASYVYSCAVIGFVGIGIGSTIEYVTHPPRDWQRELNETNMQLMELNHSYYRLHDSLMREIYARDKFVYSLATDTWKYYPCVWDVSQKYQTYVRIQANYDANLTNRKIILKRVER